jgi:hypothetical protein
MKNPMKLAYSVGGPVLAAVALLFAVGLAGSCTEEAKDDFKSRIACRHYCDKKFDCQDHDPSADELDECVGDCRNSIEDNCGNEHPQAANDKIEECVDKNCGEFLACMVFDAAPECFGFVDD